MKVEEKIEAIVGFIVLVTVMSSLCGWPQSILTNVITWGTSILIGVILSAAAAAVVESFAGDLLKNLLLTVEIAGIKFSISLFFIATMLVRWNLFWQ